MPNRSARRSQAKMQESARQQQQAEHPNRRNAAPSRTDLANRSSMLNRSSWANRSSEPNRSSIGGLDVRTIAPLCYIATIVLGFVPKFSYGVFILPLVVFLIENRSAFVRFHALQAAIFYVVSILIMMPLAAGAKWIQATYLLRIEGVLEVIVALVLMILMATVLIGEVFFLFRAIRKARHEEAYRIPFIGQLTEKAADLFGRSVGR